MAAQEGKVDVVRLLLTEAQALINIQTKVQFFSCNKSRECEQVVLFACVPAVVYHVYNVENSP